MTIHIPILNLKPHIRKLYLENKIMSLGIDYAPNSVMGWVDGDEIEVFNFSKIFKLDNRWTGYELHRNKTEIVIEITKL